MRLGLFLSSAILLVSVAVTGCSGGGSDHDQAQDDAFQKGLAEAAAKNKGSAPQNSRRGALPDVVKNQMAGKAAPGSGGAPAGGDASAKPADSAVPK
ncbi:MAG: hypothetical protein P4L46_26360 [Fimbriimonas sp.]|nr:hypothetical protein [Fimbriimonas sp.]